MSGQRVEVGKSQSQNRVWCPVAEGRDRAGFSPAELGLHCSSRAAGMNKRQLFRGTEIYHEVLAKTAMSKTLNTISSENATPTGVGGENSDMDFTFQVAQELGQKLFLTYVLLPSLNESTVSGAFKNCPRVAETYRRSLYPGEP